MILVDTNIWSLAFRRRKPTEDQQPSVVQLKALIEQDADIALPGIVLQEMLSGLKEQAQFERLKQTLLLFPLLLANEFDHLEAARVTNVCRSQGITTGSGDALIAAMCLNRDALLFTLDQDFQHIADCCDLRLLSNIP